MNESDSEYTYSAGQRPGIYAITNTVNGKQYIGQSGNVYDRWKGHRHLLRANRHTSRHLQFAWNKYGEEAFTFTVLEWIEEGDGLGERLTEREQYWMDVRMAAKGSLYNLAPAAGSNLGIQYSPETLARMREKRAANPEWRAKMAASKRGRKWSAAQRTAFMAARARRPQFWRAGLARGWQTQSAKARERQEEVIRSFDRLTETHGDSLSVGARIRRVAAEHSISLASAYGYIHAHYPDLVMSQGAKGKATRERVAAALDRIFAEKPDFVTNSNALARSIAAELELAPVSAEEVIRDLFRTGRIDRRHLSTQRLNGWAGWRKVASQRIWDAIQSWPFDTHPSISVKKIAHDLGISEAHVRAYIKQLQQEGRIPEMIVSSAEKGEATRQRMLEAIQDFEAQGGQPHHISQRELARTVAPAVGVTPDGAEGIIARLRQEGVLPPTDYVPSGLEAGHLARSAARQAAIERLFTLLQNWPFDTRPSIRIANIADALGISRDSARRYTKHLIAEGRIDRRYRPIANNECGEQPIASSRLIQGFLFD